MSSIDPLLSELFSFRIYKMGKKPLGGIDPRKRIKLGIWTDDGVDLKELSSKTGIQTAPDSLGSMMDISEITVRKGLFRKKERHLLASSIFEMEKIPFVSKGVTSDTKKNGAVVEMSSSNILHPFIEARTASGMRDLVSKLEMERSISREVPDISPQAVFRSLEKESLFGKEKDDISSLFDRSTVSGSWIRVAKRQEIKDLSSLIEFVLSSRDRDLEKYAGNGSLAEFCRSGIKSSYLEGFWSDADVGSVENLRSRFGRFLMEGPLSERTYEEVVHPRLQHISSCSPKEASRLEKELGYVMDNRSSKYLQEMVFQAPPANRPAIIRLLGRTGDRGAVNTLRKLMDFSTVDDDRKAAGEALKELGEEI